MIIQGDALTKLKELETESIDLIVTDPPYGYSFMNKDWDKAVVGVETWKECLRVLKAGAFAFIMSSPRQDVLCKMMLNLIEAGFETNFSSLYWAYASGFPKAADVSKLVDKRKGTTPDQNTQFAEYIKSKRLELGISSGEMDKQVCGGSTMYSWYEGRNDAVYLPRLEQYEKIKTILHLDDRFDNLVGEAEREVLGKNPSSRPNPNHNDLFKIKPPHDYYITKPATEQAKQLEGAYAGFQPKPAVELILVVMKPLSEKSYVDQALSNGKGITWLDDCRIPYQSSDDFENAKGGDTPHNVGIFGNAHSPLRQSDSITDKGRFPANLLCEDDVLNDGRITKGGTLRSETKDGGFKSGKFLGEAGFGEEGNYERITNYGDSGSFSRYFSLDAWWAKTLPFLITPKASKSEKGDFCSHPTVKPLKLMSYLITMGSRQGDTILDPFCGSGTTLIAAHQLHRKYIGIELNPEYCEIARKRLEPYQKQAKLL